MFPVTFPVRILSQQVSGDSWVLDPFCGRGTTLYASRLLGMPSVGIDSNPVAVALSEAKLANTSPNAIVQTAREILDQEPVPTQLPDGEFWSLAYDPQVLSTLCQLRQGLISDCQSDARKGLRAVILGALHGPVGKTRTSYFSNQCPRTYAPKPNYAVRYWRERGLRATAVDALDLIRARAERFYGSERTWAVGKTISGDSRRAGLYSHVPNSSRFSWIITSPPYYGMRTYRPDQWLRLWFMGGKPTVDYSNDGQLAHSTPVHFAAQLARVWRNVHAVSEPNARLIIRFGSINDRKIDAPLLIRQSLRETGWQVNRVTPAGSAAAGRRQAEHFSSTTKSALQEFDVWATHED